MPLSHWIWPEAGTHTWPGQRVWKPHTEGTHPQCPGPEELGNRDGKSADWRWGTRTSLQTPRSCDPLVHGLLTASCSGQRRADGRARPLCTGPQTPRPSRVCHVTGTRQALASSAWSFPTSPPSGPWQVSSSITVVPRFLNVSDDDRCDLGTLWILWIY